MTSLKTLLTMTQKHSLKVMSTNASNTFPFAPAKKVITITSEEFSTH